MACITLHNYVEESDKSNGLEAALVVIKGICTLYFLLEFLARFIFCPYKKYFIFRLINFLDLVTVLAFIVTLIVNFAALRILRIVVALRAFRILWVLRHCKLSKACAHIYREYWRDILILPLIPIFFSFIYGTLVYHIDSWDGSSILHAYYWGIISITTTGYGDWYAVTCWGKMMSVLCGMTGVFLYCFIIALFGARFLQYVTVGQYQRGPEYCHLFCLRFPRARRYQVATA